MTNATTNAYRNLGLRHRPDAFSKLNNARSWANGKGRVFQGDCGMFWVAFGRDVKALRVAGYEEV